MRFLKTLTLNRRAIYDSRVALNTDNTFTVADSTSMVLPKSDSSLTSVQTVGMIRYNTSTDDIEVYQGTGASATWRALRYREPNAIVVQAAGIGDGVNTVFSLSPQPATTASNGVTWDVEQMAKNILVIVGNVIQLANSNYVVIDGADIVIGSGALGPYTTGTKYLQFQGAIPGLTVEEPVTVIHGLDQ